MEKILKAYNMNPISMAIMSDRAQSDHHY